MVIPRVIPVLLLKNEGLVKTIRFDKEKYVGDPINAIRIFNEKEVDELIFLDIMASIERRKPKLDLIKDIASECFMPVCYGGGIKTITHIEEIFFAGIEKVSINSATLENPKLIEEAAKIYGSQSIVISIDAWRNLVGKYSVYTHRAKRRWDIDPIRHAQMMEEMGAGEILINSINQDGRCKGYDIELISGVSKAINIPVIACGGAGELGDFKQALNGGASAVAAGSFFVFHGKHRAVLVTYPKRKVLEELFHN